MRTLSRRATSRSRSPSRVFVTGSWRPERPSRRREAALRGAATSYAGGARVGAKTTLAPGAPGSDTDVHCSCRQGQDNFILGLFESGSVECRAGAPAPVRRPLRCAETPASGSGGVARRGCSERGPRSTSVYTCTYTQPKISRGERHRAADAVAGGRGADGVRPGPRRGRPASPPSRTARRLLARTGVVDDYFPRASQLSHGAVVPPSRTRTRSEPPAKSGLPRSNAHSLILREPGSLVIILRA